VTPRPEPAPLPAGLDLESELRRAPLLFERVCLEKVWGGRALEEVLGIRLDRPGPIGETWELVDREDQQSVVAEGPLRGLTLGELVRRAGPSLLGDVARARDGRFPLLVKFLDATEPLSVQVHPDDEGARRQGGASEAKTEAWYFLRDGGEVWCGFEPGVDRRAFEAALDGGRAARCLARHAVRGGTALTVRGGTVHAIGAGVTLLEVQQNSDTTYRLDDWGRVGLDGKPRDLHRDQGLEVTHFGVPPPRLVEAGQPTPAETAARSAGAAEAAANRRTLLAATEHFELEELRLRSEPLVLATEGRFQVLVGVGGPAILSAPETGTDVAIAAGDVLLVPAVLGSVRLRSAGSDPRHGAAACVVRLSAPLRRA
jgi:mannose-6-phosphate isomerase